MRKNGRVKRLTLAMVRAERMREGSVKTREKATNGKRGKAHAVSESGNFGLDSACGERAEWGEGGGMVPASEWKGNFQSLI